MILIQTLNANTAVNLLPNGQPDLSGFSEPTKSILQSAFNAGSYIDLPDEPITPVPREIDSRRLRLALLELGLLDSIEQSVNTLGEAARIEWEYATIIKEDHPIVVALSQDLGASTVDTILDLTNSYTQ